MSITTLIQTFDDLYINSAKPNSNYSDSSVILIGKDVKGSSNRALLKFDLSFIPRGSAIISSNLDLYMNYEYDDEDDDIISANIIPYAIKDKWEASEVTWNNQPSIDTSITGIESVVTGQGYYSWTLTDVVNKWVNAGLENNGLLLKTKELDIDESKRFVSSDENMPDKYELKPVLVIQYVPGTTNQPSINTIIAGRGTDNTNETVTTGDVFQTTETKNTTDRMLVSFFVNNLTSNNADVCIEVSSDGENFLREDCSSIGKGIHIFIPDYYAAYTRLVYKSSEPGTPTTIIIDYVAQA